jgi:hypothetical protein
MKTMQKWAMGAVAAVFSMGLLAGVGGAQVLVEMDGRIIKGVKGGPYTISRDGGRTWQPFKVAPRAKVQPVPQRPGIVCDIYRCGKDYYAVPAGTPGPVTLPKVGTQVIDGKKVDPKTNLVKPGNILLR